MKSDERIEIHIYANDLKKTRYFYERLLSLDLDYRLAEEETRFNFSFGGVIFFVQKSAESIANNLKNETKFSLHIRDLIELQMHLKSVNIKPIQDLSCAGVFEKIVVSDPNGYVFEFYREV